MSYDVIKATSIKTQRDSSLSQRVSNLDRGATHERVSLKDTRLSRESLCQRDRSRPPPSLALIGFLELWSLRSGCLLLPLVLAPFDKVFDKYLHTSTYNVSDMSPFIHATWVTLPWLCTNWLYTKLIDWCCFYYFVRNSLVALLEALCARKLCTKLIERIPTPPGGFLIYYVPWSRTGRKRNPPEEPPQNWSNMGVIIQRRSSSSRNLIKEHRK